MVGVCVCVSVGEGGMFFTHGPSFSLRYQNSGRIGDVHVFMKNLYRFWVYKGLWFSCLASLVDFLNSVVVFCLVVFLTTVFDWPVATACDEVSCGTVTLTHHMRLPTERGASHVLLCLILLVSSAASATYEFLKFLETCSLQMETERMVRVIVDTGYTSPFHRLAHIWRRMRVQSDGHEELPDHGLPFIGNMAWGDFLDEVCARIQRDRSFGVIEHKEFDSLRAVQALMVYENYFITFHQHGILERGALKYADENVIRMLIRSLFDEFSTLVRGKDHLTLLRWKVVKYLVVYALFYPFVVAHFLLRVLVKNAAMVRTDWGGYMTKDWNKRALWTFSLYNEVPHVLSARIASGRQIVMEMICRLKPHSSGKRFVCRIASGIILVLLSLSLVNTSLLVSGNLCGIPLLWWLTGSIAAFSVCNETPPVEREYNYLPDLERLVKQLHYSQEEWNHSGESFYSAVTWDFLESRFSVIISDIARTLFMPCILLGLLFDGSLPALMECVQSESVRVDGLGSVAREAAFDFQLLGDGNDYPLAYHLSEKLLKSIASFSAIYPKWMLKHMPDAVPPADQSGGSATSGALDILVTKLRNRVDAETEMQVLGEPSVSALGVVNSEAEITRSSALLGKGTAHEREQLFVSHMMQSIYASKSFGIDSRTLRTAKEGREGCGT